MSPALIWTLAALAGALFALWGVIEARSDLMALNQANRDNGARRIARADMRAEFIRLLIQIAWSAVGVWALDRSTPGSWSIGNAVLVVTLLLLVFNSLLDRRERIQRRSEA